MEHEYATDVAVRPLGTPRAAVARGGEPLRPHDRAAFEASFGHDLGAVRVHHDRQAAGLAEMLRARAFAIGTDVWFGQGEYAPDEAGGRELVAHELAHVVEQRSGLAIQRQAIPPELRTTPNYRGLSEVELQERYDWITSVLQLFLQSTPETALLEQQLRDIGTELARRKALAEGRTFSGQDIEKMRDYFVENAKTEKDSCIVCLNKALKIAIGKPDLPTTSETIEKTMEKVEAAGYAGPARVIAFQAKGGRITRGGARPEKLNENVWDVVVGLSGGDPGWSVFTMSLLDGYHSVTLTLDATDPAVRRVYWSDQWESKGGWKEYTRTGLDDEIVKLVQGWWDKQAVGRKHTPVVRLWRIRSKKTP